MGVESNAIELHEAYKEALVGKVLAEELDQARLDEYSDDFINDLQKDEPALYEQLMDSFDLQAGERGFKLVEKAGEKTAAISAIDKFLTGRKVDMELTQLANAVRQGVFLNQGASVSATKNSGGKFEVSISGAPMVIKLLEMDNGNWQLVNTKTTYENQNDALIDACIIFRGTKQLKNGKLKDPDIDEHGDNPFYLKEGAVNWAENNAIDKHIASPWKVRAKEPEEIVNYLNDFYRRNLLGENPAELAVEEDVSVDAPTPAESSEEEGDTSEIVSSPVKRRVAAVAAVETKRFRPKNIKDFADRLASSVIGGDALADARVMADEDVDLAEPTSNFFEVEKKKDGTKSVTVNLFTPAQIRHSRIDHFVGPDGAAVKIGEEDLKNYKLVVKKNPKQPVSTAEGVEYTWGNDTVTGKRNWVDAGGKRLLVYDGTKFDVVKKAADTVEDETAAEVAPTAPEPVDTEEQAKYEAEKAKYDEMAEGMDTGASTREAIDKILDGLSREGSKDNKKLREKISESLKDKFGENPRIKLLEIKSDRKLSSIKFLQKGSDGTLTEYNLSAGGGLFKNAKRQLRKKLEDGDWGHGQTLSAVKPPVEPTPPVVPETPEPEDGGSLIADDDADAEASNEAGAV